MLRTASPNISVITNFGCRADCWYCIWKGHELERVNQPTNWQKLRAFLEKYKFLGKVSVSGGGDSLYQWKQHKEWWMNFLKITHEIGLAVDIHTREKFHDHIFWSRQVNRCVFSSDCLDNDKEYFDYILRNTKLRITHLVTAETTRQMIVDYLAYQKQTGCQFTIKELVGHDDGGMYKKIRSQFPEIFHLDVGDYNIYYMPDNTIRNTFLEDDEKS